MSTVNSLEVTQESKDEALDQPTYREGQVILEDVAPVLVDQHTNS